MSERIDTHAPPTKSSSFAPPQSGLLQRKCVCGGTPGVDGLCPECRSKRLSLQQHPFTPDERSKAPPIVHEVLRAPGRPLDAETRSFMERRFGHDFSQVRIHDESRAAASARSVGALAYTVGHDVVFGAGQYAPDTGEGRRILAHELAHVVQQGARVTPTSTKLPVGDARDAYENEAETVATKLVNVSGPAHQPPIDLQKSPEPSLMRVPIFSSTMEICRRVLTSRVFHVSQEGLVVTANARWEASPEWQGAEAPECGVEAYDMELTRVGGYFGVVDSGYGSCEFAMGMPFSRTWTNLPEGDYYLTISTGNTNPNCCLQGEVDVSQENGLGGESCTQPPPGPLEILHGALDVAGLVPALGAVPDAINTGIYLIEGDWVGAGLSAVAIIPIFGDAASVVRRGNRVVVRVSGEAVERAGRDRIATALREARASRRVATEAAERRLTTEAADEASGLKRRILAEKNPPIADPALPPGQGFTNKFGDITYSSAGSATDRALVLAHEQVHSFLSPRLTLLRNFRADLGMAAYERSAFLKYLEEALAETYAQLRVHGVRGLPTGIRFPITNGYVTLSRVVTEVAIGTVAFGGTLYGVYVWASQESVPEESVPEEPVPVTPEPSRR